jgi:hypothetical protein
MEDEFIPNPFDDISDRYDDLSTEGRVEAIREAALDLTAAVADVLVLYQHCHADIVELAARDAEKDKRIAFLETLLVQPEVPDPQCETEEE